MEQFHYTFKCEHDQMITGSNKEYGVFCALPECLCQKESKKFEESPMGKWLEDLITGLEVGDPPS